MIPSETEQQADARPKHWGPSLLGLVLVAVLATLVIHFLGASTSPTGEQDTYRTELRTRADVERACERWVSQRLKAPATARYSGETATQGTDQIWTVTGAVDAENSFGALIRSTWECKALHGTDVVSLVSVSII